LAKVAPQLDWASNVWIGVSVEDAAELARVDDLRRVPAAVRFVSAEPLLGPLTNVDLAGIDWLIAGGESGPHHRPLDPRWVRELRDRCSAAGTAFFFKQWGGRTPKAGGRVLDGREYSEMPTGLVAAAAPANDGWSPAHQLRLPS
jgi:protein gp37